MSDGESTPVKRQRVLPESIQRLYGDPNDSMLVRATLVDYADESCVLSGFYPSEGWYWVVDVVNNVSVWSDDGPSRLNAGSTANHFDPFIQCHEDHLEEVVKEVGDWIKRINKASRRWWDKNRDNHHWRLAK